MCPDTWDYPVVAVQATSHISIHNCSPFIQSITTILPYSTDISLSSYTLFTLSVHPIHGHRFGLSPLTSISSYLFHQMPYFHSPYSHKTVQHSLLCLISQHSSNPSSSHFLIPKSIHVYNFPHTPQIPNLHYIQYPFCFSSILSFRFIQCCQDHYSLT